MRRPLAYSLWVAAIATLVAGVWIGLSGGWVEADGSAFVVVFIVLAYGTVGLMLVRKVPTNTIGWVFLTGALLLGFWIVGISYFDGALRNDWPGVEYAFIFQQTIYFPAILSLVALPLLLFPDGRAPSPRWRWVWLPILTLASMAVISNLSVPEQRDATQDIRGVSSEYLIEVDGEQVVRIENPFGGSETIKQAIDSDPGGLIYVAVVGGSLLGPVASMVYRFRRSTGVERLQIKWLAYSAAIAAGGLSIRYIAEGVISSPPPVVLTVVTVPALLGILGIPITAGMAIVRYRLYDIDRLISRTLVYGLVIALLVGVYVLGVFVLGTMLPGEDGVTVALSTLAVAALFNPLRRRAQAAIDRRFYREHYDAQAVVDEFSDRLRDEVDMASLEDELLEVVDTTVQPVSAVLWIRDTDGD